MNTIPRVVGSIKPELRVSNLRNRHLFLLDMIAFLLAPVVALMFRLDSVVGLFEYKKSLLMYCFVALLLRFCVFLPFGLYQRYWRYATVGELKQIVTAVSLSSLIIACVFYVSYGLLPQDFLLPRSLPIIEGLLVLTLVGGARFSVRLSKRPLKATFHSGASKVLIVGAGNAGQQIALDLIANSHEGLQPIGFIDDNPELHRLVIAGLPVFGGREKLAQAAESNEVSQVFIAIPSASGKVIREYLELCASANLSAKTIPGMLAILQDKVRVSHLREVEIEDLLRREPIWLNLNAARSLIDGKRVLVTGGGGSIGSEICRQALQCGPRELAVLGHGENSVFETVNSLKMMQQDRDSAPECKGVNIVGLIADVRERARIRAVIDEFRPDIIFHAAAHKHVPLMESNPVEAITNNVFGTMNVLDAAIAGDVPNFVMISTDKAVNPTSVMGASKRVAEMLVLRAAKQTGKRFVAVRFGNVLGSRGSVVPTFKKQLAIGGPLTVSHPEMQRYFMTIPEAVHLVLQAALIGKGGEVFVADMGEPVKIVDLAKDLIELSGLELGRDIDIVFTGIRPGEKLYEELFVQGEKYEVTSHDKIRIAQNASLCIPTTLNEMLSALKTATSLGKRQEIISCLQTLIPEFTPDMRLTPLTVWPEDIEELAVVRTRPIEASAKILVNA